MKKILVPTDFSENFYRLLPFLGELVRVKHPEITLLHVITAHLDPGLIPEMSADVMQHLNEAAETSLEDLSGKVKKIIPGAECRSFVRTGIPDKEITELAAAGGYDLVLMGTHGSGGSTMMIGSVAYDVMRRSSCPVLAVPFSYDLEKISSITLASDYRDKELKHFKMLVEIAGIFNAKIDVLHVGEEPGKVEVPEAAAAIHIDHYLEGVPHTFTHAKNKNVKKGITDYLAARKADLLAISPARRSWLESALGKSVTRKMLRQANIPILALK